METKKTGLSKAQIDRLGNRLRDGEVSEADLRLLDQYRRSFGGPYDYVVRVITAELKLNPTGRPAKSTPSIREKLKRESIRLTQMQDIAGCRLVVEDIREQEAVVKSMIAVFSDAIVVDRRITPSHGYRAVHMIVHHEGKPTEIQIRTRLQHRWAELSEKLSDVVDPSLKYGGGDEDWKSLLAEISEIIVDHERNEERIMKLPALDLPNALSQRADEYHRALEQAKSSLAADRQRWELFIEKAIRDFSE